MMKLDEIARLADEIDRDLEESGGEVTPEIEQKLAFFNFVEAEKVDAYGAMVKGFEARAKALKEQALEMELKAKRLESRAGWLTGRLRDFAEQRGLVAVKGRIFTAGWQKNGGVAPVLVNENASPDLLAYTTIVKTTHEWRKEEIRKALTDLTHPDHAVAKSIASIGERGSTFKIRV